jgi:leucyl aminopeptidase
VAEQFDAELEITVGQALIDANYPAIYAVGMGSPREPRLIDIRWGDEDAPKLTLVGKGVVFDTGGLDLKNSAGMKLMKKDMGGAATVLALAQMIMDAELPVRLRVLIPTVENSISGTAYRPLDVLKTRKGITVEVGNTDAEGRLILCDALAEADSEKPELLIDFATLTGAARVALGTELPALFCNDDALANAILEAGGATVDPLWRLPLFHSYRRHLDSKVADINNIANIAQGGAITAALFLNEFVSNKTPWAHIDTMAFNLAAKPGRPAGGEVFGMRAMFEMLARRYAG